MLVALLFTLTASTAETKPFPPRVLPTVEAPESDWLFAAENSRTKAKVYIRRGTSTWNTAMDCVTVWTKTEDAKGGTWSALMAFKNVDGIASWAYIQINDYRPGQRSTPLRNASQLDWSAIVPGSVGSGVMDTAYEDWKGRP